MYFLYCFLFYYHNQTKQGLFSASLAAKSAQITKFFPVRCVWRVLYNLMISLKERVVAPCFLFLWLASWDAEPAPRHRIKTTQERKNIDQFQLWTKMQWCYILATPVQKYSTMIKTYCQFELTSEIQDQFKKEKNTKFSQWMQEKYL